MKQHSLGCFPAAAQPRFPGVDKLPTPMRTSSSAPRSNQQCGMHSLGPGVGKRAVALYTQALGTSHAALYASIGFDRSG